MCVCVCVCARARALVCVCTASYGLDEDRWQAVVNKVTNIEFPYNMCNCILSDGRVSNLEMEAVFSSQTLIPTC